MPSKKIKRIAPFTGDKRIEYEIVKKKGFEKKFIFENIRDEIIKVKDKLNL